MVDVENADAHEVDDDDDDDDDADDDAGGFAARLQVRCVDSSAAYTLQAVGSGTTIITAAALPSC